MPSNHFIDRDHQFYNVLITAHGLTMVFFMVMPALIGGFGNWFIPLMIGSPDMAFPRLNNISFWLLMPAFAAAPGLGVRRRRDGVRNNSLHGGAGVGWTAYSAIVEGRGPSRPSPGPSVDMAIFALHLAGASSILGSLNFITTIFNMRAPGMTLHKMPLFVWSILVTAFSVAAVVAGAGRRHHDALLTDRNFGTTFFDPAGGGDPITSFLHLFWFFGHPEVYIMILPGFGMISQIVSTFSKKPIFVYLGMAYCGWSRSRRDRLCRLGPPHVHDRHFGRHRAPISPPRRWSSPCATGVKIFSWIATMWGGSIDFKTPMLWAIGFIFLFTIGGVLYRASCLPMPASTLALHNTYYVVGHFHIRAVARRGVLDLWRVLLLDRQDVGADQYNETFGKIHFWTTFIRRQPDLLPDAFFGARRHAAAHRVDYPDAFAGWNHIASIGAFISFASTLFFVFIVFHTLAAPARTGRRELLGRGSDDIGVETAVAATPFHSYEELAAPFMPRPAAIR